MSTSIAGTTDTSSLWSLLQALQSGSASGSSGTSSSSSSASSSDASSFFDLLSLIGGMSSSSNEEEENGSSGSGSGLGGEVMMMMLQQASSSASGDSSSSKSDSAVSAVGETSGSNPLQQMFDSIDSDGDGSITSEELSGYVESLAGSESLGAPPPPPQGGPGGAGDAAFDIVSALDSDGDGTISQSELERFSSESGGTGAEADLILTSLDGHGSISRAELSQSLKAMFDTVAASMFSGSDPQRSLSLRA